MSVLEILEELPKLSSEEQELIRTRLESLRWGNYEETDAALEAIDAGIRSAEIYPNLSVDQVRSEINSWVFRL